MTYRSLKTFLKNNTQPNNPNLFDLIQLSIKSKIILVIGEGAGNTSAYLSSIMASCEIEHFHYKTDIADVSKRFYLGNMQIDINTICNNAELILKTTNKVLSNNDLLFSLALSFCDSEYAIIEIGEEYYNHIKDIFTPFALVLAFGNDKNANSLIADAPKGISEIISLSQKDNFDYISSKYNQNGARITFASPNKITLSNSDLLGTSFYHYDYLYHIFALDLNNIQFAHLAIEAAQVLIKAPRPYIYKGLESARIPHDLVLYSLSPTVLLREGENDFKLHHRLKFKTVIENDKFEMPTENTIFCGSKEYIEIIKEKLKKR